MRISKCSGTATFPLPWAQTSTAAGPALGSAGRRKGQPDPLPLLGKWDRAQLGTFEKGGSTLLSAVMMQQKPVMG